MSKIFNDKLNELNHMLIEMGALVERTIALTNKGLVTQSIELADEAISCDREIDTMERHIEEFSHNLQLLNSPVARDLRVVNSARRIIADMERIGDQCADISEITKILADQTYIKALEHIPQMADATAKMVTDAIDAYVKQNLDLAKAVRAFDDEIDRLFLAVKNELLDLIRINPDNIVQSIDLLMIAKYFERIGDHAENIAEWVEFSITGNHPKLKQPDV